ncbi:uncharacterized protein UBRO_21076 [Ustilago bromivora]|uniref:DDE Tnp4 domain-containing protein n=1 Tax=Ustilago bromivora TaxID=307758 RepID=A0A1K0G818_9BASI|nr:uncharacterized protein UBRO_21076 [Ustilago bromivora]
MATHFCSHNTLSACTLSYASRDTQYHVPKLLAMPTSLSTFLTGMHQSIIGCIVDLSACPLKHLTILPFDSSKQKLSSGTTATQVVDVTAWVRKTTGVEEWGKGWLVVNGMHTPLAWKPEVLSREHFCYKGFHRSNVALVILPHLLQIVELVVGQPGSIQDSKVWASGSNILKKSCLYLDKGEFIWVDGGYGHSAITVGPFSHIAANKS